MSRGIRYRPLDEMLESMTMQILRAARHFDWFTPNDMATALDIPCDDVDRHRRNNFDVAMSRLTRNGHLVRFGKPMAFVYKLSATGRAEYERQIRRAA